MLRSLTYRCALLMAVIGSFVFVSSAAAEEPKAATDKEWKSLFDGKTLEGWRSSFKEYTGKVHVKEGALTLEKGMKMTGITYTGKDFPKENYEVMFDAKKVDGMDFFATTTFRVGDSHCSLVVGGWGGMVTGLSSINGADASENETTGSMEFKPGQWYQIRILVTEKKIEAWIDKEQVVNLDRKNRKISTRIECDECQPFGVATYDTVGAFRNIKIRPVKVAEKK
jgi:hypothetical protein